MNVERQCLRANIVLDSDEEKEQEEEDVEIEM